MITHPFINKEEFLLITDLYLKSEFSKEQLDDSEINKMISYSYELNDIIWRRLSRRKKFVFLIIKGLR